MANKRRFMGKKTEQIMVRLDKAGRARFDYLKDLRRNVLGEHDEDGPLARTSMMRDIERQIAELEARKAAALPVLAETAAA